MRIPLIAANWKMHKTVDEALAFVRELEPEVERIEGVEVAVAPPFTSLYAVSKGMRGQKIGLAGQDLFWEREGAYTGEISARMLVDAGCRYVIIGHSERRKYFGETDADVNRKVRAALQGGLKVIVCIGETLEEREAGIAYQVLERQVKGAFKDLGEDEAAGIVIAYEPVWAIGTGRTATPQQADEAHGRVRSLLTTLYSDECASRVRIQYGGSVNPRNSTELMAQPEIDGALVGGASLDPKSFLEIVRSALK